MYSSKNLNELLILLFSSNKWLLIFFPITFYKTYYAYIKSCFPPCWMYSWAHWSMCVCRSLPVPNIFNPGYFFWEKLVQKFLKSKWLRSMTNCRKGKVSYYFWDRSFFSFCFCFPVCAITFDVLLSTRSHSSLERNTLLLRPVHVGYKYASLVCLPIQWMPKCLKNEVQIEKQTSS